MKRVFVDTSAWFAYVNRADRDYERVRQALAAFDGRLVTSNYVFDETITLCRYRLGHGIAVAVGRTLQSTAIVDLVRVTPADERAAWALFLARDDQTYSFTDCVSFALMRRAGLNTALALDNDFASEGFDVQPSG